MSGPIDPDVSADTPAVPNRSYESGSASVGTTATLICTVPEGYIGGVVLQAASGNADPVHVGGANVTTSTGIALAAGATLPVPGGKGNARDLYGISTAAGQTVTFLFPD